MSTQKTLKVLDLFSGIGGFSLGLERAGMKTVAFCEIEEFPRKVLKKHWPDVPIFEDVRKLHAEDLPETVDVVCGGYPCQPFSVAGKRRGEEDDRHLWPEMFRLVQEVKPAWVICENVVGHIKMGLDNVLFDLESEGYSCWTFIIPAKAVGSQHLRERVWIIANATSKRLQRFEQKQRLPFGKEKTLPKLSNYFFGKWDEMARRVRNIRASDGLSVGMVRREIKAYGNAVVPQIPEMIGRAILAQQTDC